MSEVIKEMLQELETFEKTDEAAAIELRTSFTKILIEHLRKKEWTQRQLAEAAGVKESYISRVLHGECNCTFDTAAKLLLALDAKVEFRDAV